METRACFRTEITLLALLAYIGALLHKESIQDHTY